MDSVEYVKIESAVAACLAECRATDRPYLRLTSNIERLKAEAWTDTEIIELQTRVVRKLLDHDD